ncbi:MAG: ROK family transcriptional regulator [Propionibacteriaceae bacterium]|nr:ROK family transcriptional regulator [Propionibacteriaceae bacterium]
MASEALHHPKVSPLPESPIGRRVAQAQMRSANMGLLLRHLRTQGVRSRAQLATETGLSKATISSLIADLSERGLVREGEVIRGGSVGRPGQAVALDGAHVAGIGLELSVDYAALTALTLDGTVVRESVTPLDAVRLDIPTVLDRTASILERTLLSLADSGTQVVGLTVAPPGIIDYDTGTIRFAPNLGWRSVPLVEELGRRLGPAAPPIRLENDAKLAAVAEYDHVGKEGIEDLLYLSGEVGVGAGIIAGGRLVRGYSGFSGEVGHLPLDPSDTPCNCGRSGCWETIVGLTPFLTLATAADDDLRHPGRALEDRLETLVERARAGDARTLEALATIAARLAVGLGILVDVLNPRMVILGGYYAYFGDHLLPPLQAALAARRLDEGSSVELRTSRLGFISTARGGALLALEDVFSDPTQMAPTH